MEVTRKNFESVIKQVEEDIKTCAFVSLDAEFSGIESSNENRMHEVDLLQERYLKIKSAAQNFECFQFGICFWHPINDNKNGEELTASAYNFSLFKEGGRTNCYMSQTASIKFLASHKFDFNQIVQNGIPYLNEKEVQDRSRHLLRYSKPKSQQQQRGNKIILDKYQTQFIDEIKKQVTEWLNMSTSPKLSLSPCDAYKRRIIYQEISDLFPERILLMPENDEKGSCWIVVKRVTNEDKKEALQKEIEEKLAKEMGFRRIALLLTQRKDLVIVGHNLILDLAHFFDKFIRELPDTVEEFKQELHTLFPRIYDTKIMIEQHQDIKKFVGSNSSLEKSFEKFEKSAEYALPTVQIKEGSQKYKDNNLLHQAGFDAFATGAIFAKISHYIGTRRDAIYKQTITCLDHIKDDFENILYMMKLDAPMFICKEQVPFERSNVLVLYEFPEHITNDDIYPVLKPFGNFRLVWVNENLVYAMMQDAKTATECNLQLNKNSHKNEADASNSAVLFKVMPYYDAKQCDLIAKLLKQVIVPSGKRQRSADENGQVNEPQPKKQKKQVENPWTDCVMM